MSRNDAGGAQAREPRDAYDVVGDSPQMQRIRERIARAAPAGATVLITGGQGVGKEWLARAIHGRSARSALPFVAVRGEAALGAILEPGRAATSVCRASWGEAAPGAILDPEPPGGGPPPAVGAGGVRPGGDAVAEPGTLFLTDIGETSPAMQLSLLRFLKERRFRRTGRIAAGAGGKAGAARIVAATTRNLAAMVENGDFRRDLFYRLSVVRINVPPLRARRLDILPLARRFAERFAAEADQDLRGFSPAAERALEAHAWPGNAGELESVVERAVVLESADRVEVESLELDDGPGPDARTEATPPPPSPAAGRPVADHPDEVPAHRLPDSGFVLERHVQGLEREYLAQALRQAGAGAMVRDAGELARALLPLLHDGAARREMGARARAVILERQGATQRNYALLRTLMASDPGLLPLPGRGRAPPRRHRIP